MTTISLPLSHEHGDVAHLHGRMSRAEIREVLAVEAEEPDEEPDGREGEAP